MSFEQLLRLFSNLLISFDNNPQHEVPLLICIEKSIMSSGILKRISSLSISMLLETFLFLILVLKQGIRSFASINLSVAEDQSSFKRTIDVSRLISKEVITFFWSNLLVILSNKLYVHRTRVA